MAGSCECFFPNSSPEKLGVLFKLHTGEHVFYRYIFLEIKDCEDIIGCLGKYGE